MPFGAVYGGLLFLLLAILFGLPFWKLIHPDFRLTEIALGLLSATVAAGLWSGRAWARWLGIVLSLACALLLWNVGVTATGMLVILAAILGAVLLAVPATGRWTSEPAPEVREAPEAAEAGSVPSRRGRGRILGGLAIASILAATVSFAVTWSSRGPVPEREVDLAAIGLHIVDWHEFGPGIDRAALESKPVLVDFFAEWCGPCKAMERKTFRDPDVVQALDDVIAVRIDAESSEPVHGYVGEQLADRYRVVSYPTLVLMDVEGREIARGRGYMNPKQFLAWLDGALAKARENRTVERPETSSGNVVM